MQFDVFIGELEIVAYENLGALKVVSHYGIQLRNGLSRRLYRNQPAEGRTLLWHGASMPGGRPRCQRARRFALIKATHYRAPFVAAIGAYHSSVIGACCGMHAPWLVRRIIRDELAPAAR